jgi:hypothetical protein
MRNGIAELRRESRRDTVSIRPLPSNEHNEDREAYQYQGERAQSDDDQDFHRSDSHSANLRDGPG